MSKPLISSSPRLFTVEAANKTLPLVAAIVADLAPLEKAVTSAGKRIEHLLEDRDMEEGDPYADELAAMRERLASDTLRIQGYIDELRQIGVEFKGPGGHVGFPAMLHGRLAYLSWKLGEPEVTHWFDLDGGEGSRQSLLVGVAEDEKSAI